MSSAFAQLPAAVSSGIFLLTPFLDTLRCEQVCRSWQKGLNRSSATNEDLFPTWSHGIWGKELKVYFVKTEKEREEPALKLEQFINRKKYSNLFTCKQKRLH